MNMKKTRELNDNKEHNKQNGVINLDWGTGENGVINLDWEENLFDNK